MTSKSSSSIDNYGVTHSSTLSYALTVTQATTCPNYVANYNALSSHKVCPSFFYINTTFWLLTSIAQKGTFRLFKDIVYRVGYILDFGFGLGRVIHQLCSPLPIWRDLFPNRASPTNFKYVILTN